MLHRTHYVFINGTSFEVNDADLACLKALAEQRRLSGAEFEKASEDVIDALHTWYNDGWLLV
jgi:50S ribosomal protein L16 3-hydroxylase